MKTPCPYCEKPLEIELKRLEDKAPAYKPEWHLREAKDWSNRSGVAVDMIVLHHTSTDQMNTRADSIIRYWDRKEIEASAHFIIEGDGTVTRAVDVTRKAWHAMWVNSRSVGIELCGDMGDKLTDAQSNSLKWVIETWILPKFPIKQITGHRFLGMATDCPGSLFPTQESINDWCKLNGINL